MALKVTNNAASRLTSALSTSATTVALTSGTGSKFPTLSAGDWFPLTLVKLVSGEPVIEIVKCTARTGDTLTVERATEGTTVTDFAAGDRAELRFTAAAIATFIPQGGGATFPALHADEFTATNATIDKVRAKNFIDKTVTNATATGAVTLDLSAADVFELTLSGATTLSVSNAPTLSGETFAIVVRVTQGATAYSLTWFSGITWLTANGAAPDAPAAGKTIEYVLTTTNGTSWLARKGGAN